MLEFETDAALDQADYSITVTFAEGASVTSAPCAVIADNDPKYDKNKLKWTLLNAGHTDVFLEAVSIEWPTENGVIHKITFDGEPVFLTETEFGKIFNGKKEEDRFVWTGYVDQPAAAILRVDEAQKANKGYATVAIIDTGVDPEHWLLVDALVPGYDFLRDETGFASEVDALLDQSVMALLDNASHLPLEEEEIVQLNQSVMALLDADQEAGLDGDAPAAGLRPRHHGGGGDPPGGPLRFDHAAAGVRRRGPRRPARHRRGDLLRGRSRRQRHPHELQPGELSRPS